MDHGFHHEFNDEHGWKWGNNTIVRPEPWGCRQDFRRHPRHQTKLGHLQHGAQPLSRCIPLIYGLYPIIPDLGKMISMDMGWTWDGI